MRSCRRTRTMVSGNERQSSHKVRVSGLLYVMTGLMRQNTNNAVSLSLLLLLGGGTKAAKFKAKICQGRPNWGPAMARPYPFAARKACKASHKR
eukprot:scaffold7176_cov145-Amphora_coffeaeformis.AAC.6